MRHSRLALLAGSLVLLPLPLVAGAAGSAAAVVPGPTFGPHASSCAQASDGFTAEHNPSHHLLLHHSDDDGHC